MFTSYFPEPVNITVCGRGELPLQMGLRSLVTDLKIFWPLADVAQLVGGPLAKLKLAGSIPGQGTCLGCRPGPPLGHVEEATLIDVSLPLFLHPFPSL